MSEVPFHNSSRPFPAATCYSVARCAPRFLSVPPVFALVIFGQQAFSPRGYGAGPRVLFRSFFHTLTRLAACVAIPPVSLAVKGHVLVVPFPGLPVCSRPPFPLIRVVRALLYFQRALSLSSLRADAWSFDPFLFFLYLLSVVLYGKQTHFVSPPPVLPKPIGVATCLPQLLAGSPALCNFSLYVDQDWPSGVGRPLLFAPSWGYNRPPAHPPSTVGLTLRSACLSSSPVSLPPSLLSHLDGALDPFTFQVFWLFSLRFSSLGVCWFLGVDLVPPVRVIYSW